jgi:hypothetical protein
MAIHNWNTEGGAKRISATDVGGAVTINSLTGVITTATLTTVAGAVYTLIVTNASVATSDIIQVTLGTYSGTMVTNGLPVLLPVSILGAGSFAIQIVNLHGVNALNGTLKIWFSVLKG